MFKSLIVLLVILTISVAVVVAQDETTIPDQPLVDVTGRIRLPEFGLNAAREIHNETDLHQQFTFAAGSTIRVPSEWQANPIRVGASLSNTDRSVIAQVYDIGGMSSMEIDYRDPTAVLNAYFVANDREQMFNERYVEYFRTREGRIIAATTYEVDDRPRYVLAIQVNDASAIILEALCNEDSFNPADLSVLRQIATTYAE